MRGLLSSRPPKVELFNYLLRLRRKRTRSSELSPTETFLGGGKRTSGSGGCGFGDAREEDLIRRFFVDGRPLLVLIDTGSADTLIGEYAVRTHSRDSSFIRLETKVDA